MTSHAHPSVRPVLILIHGAGLNGASWNPVRRHIDPRFDVVTPDLPGHGSRIGEAFTLAGAVQTVVDAARAAGDAPVIVGGDSLGGYTSTASAAALQPSQLRGLVLSGCTANLEGALVLLPFHLKAIMIRLSLALMKPEKLDASLVKQLRKFGISEADAAEIVAARCNPGVFPQAVAALRGVDFRAKAAAITQPVIFVNGSKDSIFVNQEDAFFAAAQSPSRYRFEGTEHGVSLIESEAFAAMVNRFALPLVGLEAQRSAA